MCPTTLKAIQYLLQKMLMTWASSLKIICSSHINNVIAHFFGDSQSHTQMLCVQRREVPLLCRALTVYMRSLFEYASYVWSPRLIKAIERLERVQRRFTKRLCAGASKPRGNDASCVMDILGGGEEKIL